MGADRLEKKTFHSNKKSTNTSFVPQMAVHLARQDQLKNKAPDTSIEPGIEATNGKGDRLNPEIQTEMESKIGADFSDVRIHNNKESAAMSQEIGAKAFTKGSDIYFNKGGYDPFSKEGKHLLAHELVHTKQQKKSGQPTIQRKLIADDPSIKNDLSWSFTKKDAKQFKYTGKGPVDITMKKKGRKPDDPFRYKILKKLIDSNHTIRLVKITRSDILPDFKDIKSGIVSPQLVSNKTLKNFVTRRVSFSFGAMLASEQLALSANPKFSGPASATNESILYYVHPEPLIHEIGHAYLFLSGVDGGHSTKITSKDNIEGSDGESFTGEGGEYLKLFVNEKTTRQDFNFTPGDQPHFSPTKETIFHIPKKHRKSPNQKEFRGNWYDFKKEYPLVQFIENKQGIGYCWRKSMSDYCSNGKD